VGVAGVEAVAPRRRGRCRNDRGFCTWFI
jgi:hypothetical protein